MESRNSVIFATAISILALLTSFGATYVSKVAYDLSVKTYESERRIVLISNIEENRLFLKSLGSEQIIDSITSEFPTMLDLEGFSISSPDLSFNANKVIDSVKRLVSDLVPPQEYPQVLNHYSIPVLVSLSGYSKGETFLQVSTYDMVFKIVITKEQIEVELKNFVIKDVTPDAMRNTKYIDLMMDYKMEIFREANKDLVYSQ